VEYDKYAGRMDRREAIGFAWIADLGKVELKNDRYRKARGGKASFLTIFCSRCKNPVLVYQKDGDGTLQRCYLNRIFGPSALECLQRKPDVKRTSDLPSFMCSNCNQLIGSPMVHNDGRFAFRLHKGTFTKKWGISLSL